MDANEAALLDELTAMQVAWTVQEHPAVFTVEASAELHATIAGLHTKNLFLHDGKDHYWLVTAPHDARVDLKALAPMLGARRFSFGKADAMERLLGVTPGSVTPLAARNDRDRAVTVVLDARLAAAALVQVHPLRNTATLGLTGADLVRYLTRHHRAPTIAALPAPPA